MRAVLAGTHVGVVGIHARGLDADLDLTRCGLRVRGVLEFQDFRTAKLMNSDRFHAVPRYKVKRIVALATGVT